MSILVILLNGFSMQDVNKLLLLSATNLSLSDRRLYNYLLHHSLSQLSKRLDFSIPLTDLEGVFGRGLPPLNRLQESIHLLMRTLIEFEVSPSRWVTTSLLAGAEIDVAQSKLYYSYQSACQKLLIKPSTLERCLIQAHFTLKYSNLLYEILSEQFYEKQLIFTITIDSLRTRLEVGSKLSNFSDLDRFVLVPAVKEINSYARFAVKYHTLRKGMKVTHVVYEITPKRNIATVEDIHQVIPPKRPRLFIDNPASERAYAYLLNAETKIRRKYFELSIKLAAKNKISIPEEDFDRPDLWFTWVEAALIRLKQ